MNGGQSKPERAASVDRTNWHDLADEDIDEILAELNEQLQDHGFRSRFRIVSDEFGWDVIVDDGAELELVKTVEAAERITEELCNSGLL
jgi:hypothetical protein